jgi:predicted dienelactone hydrolase
MKRKYTILGVIAVAGIATGVVLTQGRADPGPPGERPELARRGELGVGTVLQDFALAPRARITTTGAITGNLPVEPRSLKVRIWYPANVAASAPRVRFTHDVALPGRPLFPWATQGVAADAAPALTGKRFPLILLSHGYGGWSEYASNLAESLAAKGYVVAAIDHADMPFDSTRTFLMSFGNVLLDRAQDQREVLDLILKRAGSEKTGFASLIDRDKIGLIGYSMGGYGALATAGAPYDATSKTISQLPATAQKSLFAADPATSSRIKALVTISPWGGQPDNRVWKAEALAQIKAPVLMIAGDHDDVVNFKEGVSWIFDSLTGTDHRLLVYREARHNIAGNPVPVTDQTDFQTLEFFTEPVWRIERLNMINQHFISAFFDLTLKGDTAKAAYLNVPTQNAGDGDWPSAPGEQLGGKMANADQPNYWRGFQRRWALGLELRRAEKGRAGAIPRGQRAPTSR